MPETKFSADPKAIEALISFVLEETDCREFETYSRFDSEVQQFYSVPELLAALDPGTDRTGHESARQLSLWSPNVMPPPRIKRISLKVKGHTFRYTVQGCGLFTLLIGVQTPSSLSYWSEAGARERCSVEPGPAAVNWPAHRKLGGRLSRRAKRFAGGL